MRLDGVRRASVFSTLALPALRVAGSRLRPLLPLLRHRPDYGPPITTIHEKAVAACGFSELQENNSPWRSPSSDPPSTSSLA